ncbi:MAG: hypothetical protein QW578_06535 [Thermoplasmatales archaeon]
MKTSTIIIAIIGIAIIGYLVYKYVYLPKTSSNITSTTTSTTIPSTISSVSNYTAPSSSSTTLSTTSSQSSTSSSITTPYHLTSVTQNYYTPPSNGLQIASKTSQIAYAQKIACQRFPQICAKEAPYLFSGNGPVTAYSPIQFLSTVHQSNPVTISTGIEKYVHPAGGIAYSNWGTKTVTPIVNPPSTGIGKYIRPMGEPTMINKKINVVNPPSIGIGKYIRPIGGIANPNGEPKTVNRNSYSYEQEIEKINKPFMKKVSAITTSTQPQKTTSSSSSFTIHRPGLPTLSELKKQNPYLR